MMAAKPWPWNRIPDPRPADWGVGMTVCIAAMGKDNTLILATDSMVSTEHFCGDNLAFKGLTIHPDWKVLISGNDLSRIESVLQHVRVQLGQDDEPAQNPAPPCSLATIEEALQTAWMFGIRQRAEVEILGRYGISMQEFIEHGPKYFGGQFSEMKYQIDSVTLGFSLLVAGYDRRKVPHILSIGDPGLAENHDLYGFWASGSGAQLALSSLFSRNIALRAIPMPVAVYTVCAAKFSSESAPMVGKHTAIFIMYPDGDADTGAGSDTDDLRKWWEENEKPQVRFDIEDITKASMMRFTKGRFRVKPSSVQT